MPSTVVHVAFGLVLAIALLRGTEDRGALVFLVVLLVLPDLDTVLGPIMAGAHRTVLHTLLFPAAIAALMAYDTRVRDRSLLRDRLGEQWIRVAWAGTFALGFGHLLLDYVYLDGINALWPFRDQFYRLSGEMVLSTSDGLTQTFVDLSPDAPEPERRSRQTVHVNNPVEPSRDPPPAEPVDRLFPFAVTGRELYLIVLAAFVLAARRLQREGPDEA